MPTHFTGNEKNSVGSVSKYICLRSDSHPGFVELAVKEQKLPEQNKQS